MSMTHAETITSLLNFLYVDLLAGRAVPHMGNPLGRWIISPWQGLHEVVVATYNGDPGVNFYLDADTRVRVFAAEMPAEIAELVCRIWTECDHSEGYAERALKQVVSDLLFQEHATLAELKK